MKEDYLVQILEINELLNVFLQFIKVFGALPISLVDTVSISATVVSYGKKYRHKNCWFVMEAGLNTIFYKVVQWNSPSGLLKD